MRTLLVLVVAAGAAAGEESGSGAFSQTQVDAGRALADLTCSQCHTPALTGRKNQGEQPPLSALSEAFQKFVGAKGIVPPLVGPEFIDKYGSKTVPEFAKFLQGALTTFLPDRKDEDSGLNVTAYILMKNGLMPGTRPMKMTDTAQVSSLFSIPVAQSASGIFTQAQADAGHEAYLNTCGKCHTITLLGRKGDSSEQPPISSLPDSYKQFIGARGYVFVPPLAGKDFLDRWGSKTAAQLVARFKVTADDRSFQFEGMNDETVVNITAYVLQVNGAKAGEQPLTLATDAIVNSITR